MIEIKINNNNIIVDHNYTKCNKDNIESKIAEELVKAIDIICADLYVNSNFTVDEKVEKALESRNKILELMSKHDFTCEEYFI